MAEMVMKNLVKKAGLEKDFYIDSAATDRDEIGNGMHHGTITELKKHEIPFTNHRARLVKIDDYNDFDFLICMDDENLAHLERRIGNDTDGKVHKLLEYCGKNRDVADPLYTGNFIETYADVTEGCKALLEQITVKNH